METKDQQIERLKAEIEYYKRKIEWLQQQCNCSDDFFLLSWYRTEISQREKILNGEE